MATNRKSNVDRLLPQCSPKSGLRSFIPGAYRESVEDVHTLPGESAHIIHQRPQEDTISLTDGVETRPRIMKQAQHNKDYPAKDRLKIGRCSKYGPAMKPKLSTEKLRMRLGKMGNLSKPMTALFAILIFSNATKVGIEICQALSSKSTVQK
jgi:hypothetical protein